MNCKFFILMCVTAAPPKWNKMSVFGSFIECKQENFKQLNSLQQFHCWLNQHHFRCHNLMMIPPGWISLEFVEVPPFQVSVCLSVSFSIVSMILWPSMDHWLEAICETSLTLCQNEMSCMCDEKDISSQTCCWPRCSPHLSIQWELDRLSQCLFHGPRPCARWGECWTNQPLTNKDPRFLDKKDQICQHWLDD